jgi:hypothetical protein
MLTRVPVMMVVLLHGSQVIDEVGAMLQRLGDRLPVSELDLSVRVVDIEACLEDNFHGFRLYTLQRALTQFMQGVQRPPRLSRCVHGVADRDRQRASKGKAPGLAGDGAARSCPGDGCCFGGDVVVGGGGGQSVGVRNNRARAAKVHAHSQAAILAIFHWPSSHSDLRDPRALPLPCVGPVCCVLSPSVLAAALLPSSRAMRRMPKRLC